MKRKKPNIDRNTDVPGDGTNVAARLEGIAEPGGIVSPRMRSGCHHPYVRYRFHPLGTVNPST